MGLFQSKSSNYQVNSSSLSIGHVNLLESLDIFEWSNTISEQLESFLKTHYYNPQSLKENLGEDFEYIKALIESKFDDISSSCLEKTMKLMSEEQSVAKEKFQKHYSSVGYKIGLRPNTFQSLTSDNFESFVVLLDGENWIHNWMEKYIGDLPVNSFWTADRALTIMCFDLAIVKSFRDWINQQDTETRVKQVATFLDENGSTMKSRAKCVQKMITQMMEKDIIFLNEFNNQLLQDEDFSKFWTQLKSSYHLHSITDDETTFDDHQQTIVLVKKSDDLIYVNDNKFTGTAEDFVKTVPENSTAQNQIDKVGYFLSKTNAKKLVSVNYNFKGQLYTITGIHSASNGSENMLGLHLACTFSQLLNSRCIVAGDFNTDPDKKGACSPKTLIHLGEEYGLQSVISDINAVSTSKERSMTQPQLHKARQKVQCLKDFIFVDSRNEISNVHQINSFDGSYDANRTLPNSNWSSDHSRTDVTIHQ